jgi:hypothetical protein
MFVLFHELKHPWTAVSAYSLMGFNMTMLRVLSGGIAMPMGYHWAWNCIQNAVIGADPSMPSLLSVTVDGPPRWTGTLGESSPGWLMVLIQGITALILGILGWRSKTRKHV